LLRDANWAYSHPLETPDPGKRLHRGRGASTGMIFMSFHGPFVAHQTYRTPRSPIYQS
jgi:hypothetical protein